MRELLKRLFKMTAGYGLVQWGGPVLSLLFTPIIMRSLGPAEYGAADFILTCVSALSTLALFALPSALQTHYNDQQSAEGKQRLVGGALMLGIAFSLALGLPFAIFPETAAELLGVSARYAPLLRWAGLLIWPGVAGVILTTAAQSALRVRWGMIISAVTIVTAFSSNLILIVVLNWGAAGLVSTQLLVGIMTCLVGIVLARPLFGRPDRDGTRRLAVSGATLLPTMVAAWALSVADRFFLVRVVSTTELGYYATAVKVASLLFVALSPLYSAWMPIALAGQHDEASRERYPAVSRYLVGIALFGSLLLTLFSAEVLSLFGLRDYSPATPYIGMLTYPHIFAAISVPLNVNQMKQKKLGILSGSVVLGAVVNMLLNYLLIPGYGVWGAVIATVIGYGIPVAVVFLNARRVIGIPYPMRIVFSAVAGHLALILVWIAIPGLPLEWRIPLKLASLLALVVWCIMVGLIQKMELQKLRLIISNQLHLRLL